MLLRKPAVLIALLLGVPGGLRVAAGCGDDGGGTLPGSTGPCATDEECAPGLRCEGGLCQPPAPDGSETDAPAGAGAGEDAALPGPDGAADAGTDADGEAPGGDAGPADAAGTDAGGGPDVSDSGEAPDGDAGAPGKCEGHGDCPGLQLCSAGDCVEPPLCLTEDDCLGARVCDHGRCADTWAGCATNADCAGNGACDPLLHECASVLPCASDGQCTGGLRCKGGACVECLTATDCPSATMTCAQDLCHEPETCASMADCLAGDVCAGGACVFPAVPLDAFEPNAIPAAAKALVEGSQASLTIDPWHDDWFLLSVPKGHGLLVRASHPPAPGQLVLTLLDPSGLHVLDTQAASAGSALVAQPPVAAPQVYRLRVQNPHGHLPEYGIEVFLPPKPFCRGDAADLTGTGDSPGDALGPYSPAYMAAPLRICAGDSDWFELSLPIPGTLWAQILFPEAYGKLEAALYDVDFELLALSQGAGDHRSVLAGDLPAGTYMLEVQGTTAQSANSYALETGSTPAGTCVFDEHELNDSALAASPFLGKSTQLILCGGDEDWFVTEVPKGMGLLVGLGYNNIGTSLVLELIDSDGVELLASDSGPAVVQGQVALAVALEEAGKAKPVYARVSRAGPPGFASFTPYTLDVQVTGAFCIDDAHEPDGSPAEAQPAKLLPGQSLEGKLCPGDSGGDWFAFPLQASEVLSVDLLHDTAGSPLSLTFYHPDGITPLGLSALPFLSGAGSSAILDVQQKTGGITGTYYAHLTGGAAAAWSLGSVTADPSKCPDDALEPNDTLLTSKALATDAPKAGWFCPQNPDVFHFLAGPEVPLVAAIEAPDTFQVTLVYYGPKGQPLLLELLPGSGAVDLSGLTASEGWHFVSIRSPVKGGYTLTLLGGPPMN